MVDSAHWNLFLEAVMWLIDMGSLDFVYRHLGTEHGRPSVLTVVEDTETFLRHLDMVMERQSLKLPAEGGKNASRPAVDNCTDSDQPSQLGAGLSIAAC